MSGTRTTRSGAIFPPWELSRCYQTSASIFDLAVSVSTVTERAEEINGELDAEPGIADRKTTKQEQSAASEILLDSPQLVLYGQGMLSNPEGMSNHQSPSTDVQFDPDDGFKPPMDACSREGNSVAEASGGWSQPKTMMSSRMEGGSEGFDQGVPIQPGAVELRDRISNEHITIGNGLSRAQRMKARANAHKHSKRRDSRKKVQDAAGASIKRVAMKRVAESDIVALNTLDATQLPHTERGYVGLVPRKPEVRKTLSDKDKASTMTDLLDMGFQYIPWTGESGIGILDCERRLVVGGGMPRSDDWTQCANRLADTIEAIRSNCKFTSKQLDHARGPFPAMAHGIAYGQGQPHPMIHAHSKANANVFSTLLSDPDMIRVAGFQSHLLASFAPDLNVQYKEVLEGILCNQPELKRNFANSNYATITVNFGPKTVSTPHIDVADLAYGLCAITALGNFDPDLGGQLVLWDLKVVIRFPPGSTLLVPSAIVRHSNLPIGSDESRYSVTQYSAGHLFRWFNNGYRSDKEVEHEAALNGISDNSYLQTQWETGLSKLRRYP